MLYFHVFFFLYIDLLLIPNCSEWYSCLTRHFLVSFSSCFAVKWCESLSLSFSIFCRFPVIIVSVFYSLARLSVCSADHISVPLNSSHYRITLDLVYSHHRPRVLNLSVSAPWRRTLCAPAAAATPSTSRVVSALLAVTPTLLPAPLLGLPRYVFLFILFLRCDAILHCSINLGWFWHLSLLFQIQLYCSPYRLSVAAPLVPAVCATSRPFPAASRTVSVLALLLRRSKKQVYAGYGAGLATWFSENRHTQTFW